MNPFVYYLDHYTYAKGNPDLKPEYANNVEINPQIQAAYKIRSLNNTDDGVRYSFPNQNGSLKLGMSDIFHSQIAKLYSVIGSNDFSLRQYSTITNVRLTFTSVW